MNNLINKTTIKIILLLMIFTNIFNNTIYSQDNYPKPFKFNYVNKGTNYTNHPLDGNLFTQDSFWLGTQWGGNSKILKALKMNGNQGFQPAGADTNFIPSRNTDTKLQYIHDNKAFNEGRGFQFEPTLYIPQNQRGQLITRNSHIWGFSKVLGDTTNITTDENYDRLRLLKNASYKNSIVLEKSWINNNYLLYGDPNKSNYDHTTGGTQWIFSINLRRVNKSEFKLDTSTGRVPVLTVKLPYQLVGDTTKFYIKFNKTSQNLNNNELLTYSPENSIIDTLGYNVLMDTLSTNVTEFIIYDDMLPDSLFWKNKKRQDITLNAFFICDGDITNNKLLKVDNNDIGKIDFLDIEVKYHGNTDVAINHLRIATSGGNDFFLGKNYNDNRLFTQQSFDVLKNIGYEIYGKYLRDEAEEPYFSMMRYVAEIFNFEVFSEGAGGDFMNHFITHVKPKNVWIGSIGMLPSKAVPYNAWNNKNNIKKSQYFSKTDCYTLIFQKR